MRCASFLVSLAVLASVALLVGRGHAQSPAAPPDLLLDRAKMEIAAGNYARACPLLAERHRLAPSGDKILNLALCLELQGKRASAWRAFKEAIAYAIKNGSPATAQAMKYHLEALEPELQRLSVRPRTPLSSPALAIAVDDEPIAPTAWGALIPVDEGRHHITATCGTRQWTFEIEVSPHVRSMAMVLPIDRCRGD